jgi:hypothetical protein
MILERAAQGARETNAFVPADRQRVCLSQPTDHVARTSPQQRRNPVKSRQPALLGTGPTSVSTFGSMFPAVSTPATRRESSMGGAEVPTAMRGDAVT